MIFAHFWRIFAHKKIKLVSMPFSFHIWIHRLVLAMIIKKRADQTLRCKVCTLSWLTNLILNGNKKSTAVGVVLATFEMQMSDNFNLFFLSLLNPFYERPLWTQKKRERKIMKRLIRQFN